MLKSKVIATYNLEQEIIDLFLNSFSNWLLFKYTQFGSRTHTADSGPLQER